MVKRVDIVCVLVLAALALTALSPTPTAAGFTTVGFNVTCQGATGYGTTSTKPLYWTIRFYTGRYAVDKYWNGSVPAYSAFNPTVAWNSPVVPGTSADASYYWW